MKVASVMAYFMLAWTLGFKTWGERVHKETSNHASQTLLGSQGNSWEASA